jgi:predicted nucleic acid-binding Zn ribbon protein
VQRFSQRRKRKRDAKLGPSAAGKALGSVLKKHGIASEIREHRLLIQWEKVVGPRVAARTTPDALDKGTLWVRVDSSSWMHQLSFLKSDIIAKANALCGQELVTDIRFHLGRRKVQANDPLSAADRIRRPKLQERPLPPPAQGEALAAIQHEAGGIEDEELREAIIDVRRRLNL